MSSQIKEFLQQGYITEAEDYRKSDKLARILELEQIHGVGGKTARKLVNSGIQNLEEAALQFNTQWTDEFAMKYERVSLPVIAPKILFFLRIPRIEVEEIAALVGEHLYRINSGCEYTITGGLVMPSSIAEASNVPRRYRRGKPESNDIDIVITHREANTEKGILEALVNSLAKAGKLSGARNEVES